MDWNSFCAVIVGGFFTLLGTVISYVYQSKLNKDAEKSLINGALKGIHQEIRLVCKIFDNNIGSNMGKTRFDDSFIDFCPVTQDYFQVYGSNTYMIGKINDDNLIKKLIKTYNFGKEVLDSFHANNDLITEYRKKPNSEILEFKLITHMKLLQENQIKFKNSADALDKMITSYFNNSRNIK